LIRLARQVTEERRKQESEVEATARKQGEYIAELARRRMTYLEIGKLLDLDDSTAHRIAKRATE
jgi:hypothetical protein